MIHLYCTNKGTHQTSVLRGVLIMNIGEIREQELARLYNAIEVFPNESGLLFPDFIAEDGKRIQVKAQNGTVRLFEGMEQVTLEQAIKWYMDNVASDYIILAWEGKRRGKEHVMFPVNELINYSDLFRLTWSSSGHRAIQFTAGANKAGKRFYNIVRKG